VSASPEVQPDELPPYGMQLYPFQYDPVLQAHMLVAESHHPPGHDVAEEPEVQPDEPEPLPGIM
jgi:hypothetical protein